MLRVVSCQVHVKVMVITIRLSLELGYLFVWPLFLCLNLVMLVSPYLCLPPQCLSIHLIGKIKNLENTLLLYDLAINPTLSHVCSLILLYKNCHLQKNKIKLLFFWWFIFEVTFWRICWNKRNIMCMHCLVLDYLS